MTSAEITELLHLLATDPNAAADRMEDLGRRLIARANQIRAARAATKNPYATPGGAGDQVTIRLIGPDGRPKTNGSNN